MELPSTRCGTDAAGVQVRGADPALQQWMDEAVGLLDAGHVAPAAPPTAEQVYRALQEALPEQEVGPGLPLPAPELGVDLPPPTTEEPTGEPAEEPHDHGGGGRHSWGTSLAHRVAHACGYRHG